MQKRNHAVGRFTGWRKRRRPSDPAARTRSESRAEGYQTRLVRLLQDVAVAANESDSIPAALQFGVDRICAFLGWPIGHALLRNDEGSLVSSNIWHFDSPGNYKDFNDQTMAMRFAPGYGLPGKVVETRGPVWIPSMAIDPLSMRHESAQAVGIQTGLAIPLVTAREVAGVLEFFHTRQIPPDPSLLAVLPHVGVQLGRVVERQRAQDALRKNAAQMRLIITSLPLILWVTDRSGSLVMLEGRGVTSLGIQPETVLGKSLFNLAAGRADIHALIERSLAGEEIHTQMSSATQAYEVFFTPLYDANQAVDGVIGLAFDITAQRRMEEELDEMKHRLLDSVENERARLGQQIHDGPLQDLFGAFYQIQEVQPALDPTGQQVVENTLNTLRDVSATLRVICGELRPSTLVHLGLQRAIHSHAERMQERAAPGPGGRPPQIHLDLPDTRLQLPYNLRLSLFRVYQQLIENALLHGQAANITVSLRIYETETLLSVSDDGVGFRLPASWVELVRRGGFGLVSVIERVEGMDGSIDIQSAPGQGTHVQVRVPIPTSA